MHKSHRSGNPPASRRCGHPRGAKVLFIIAVAMAFATIADLTLAAQVSPPTTASTPQAGSQTAASTTQSFDLSDEVVRDVLTNLQRGLETHDIDRVLAIFDADNMKDYPRFRDQIVAFFRLHDSIKFRYQLLQVTDNKDAASATADFEMDADPADILPTERRRTGQMRFQLKRVGTAWKVTDLSPTDFFNQ